MQVNAFKILLDKYKDYDHNPAAESVEKVIERMRQPLSDYYYIRYGAHSIGAIRALNVNDNDFRISPIFILPEFQGRGYGKKAIEKIESLYPSARCWLVSTIKQEKKLCGLYEKMGYKATGEEEIFKDGMTIIHYKKNL